ncbi:hypothetical protein Fmac_014081 [Flemingia macrophylla]|uniref:25S rRNA (uridine-N(3))-methyltransferase BMT5-like domain-containing protein n=1 Tax=Flemingia macrophylla TaxID=520843 RepID=A0ABD1MBG9_9FABA
MEEESKNRVSIMEEEEAEAKWVIHYSSDHHIPLVGEGDFSFSLFLAKSFASAANIVASSLNSYDDVVTMYKHAKSNLDDLNKLGACILHGVNATKMKLHPDLKMRRFDRVVFNFPHAGFHGKEDNPSLIKMHKELVLGFFKNASRMLRPNGQIHVSHKTTPPFDNWDIEKLATECFLTLIECADFKREDYPGYNNKRGDGRRCDEHFPLGKCCTYKFIFIPKTKRTQMKRNQTMVTRQQSTVEQIPISGTSIFGLTNIRNRHASISEDHFNSMVEVHRRGAHFGGRSAYFGPSLGSLRTINNAPFSHDAKYEGFWVYGGSSNSFQDEFGRTPVQRASDYSDEGHTMRDPWLKYPNVLYELRKQHLRENYSFDERHSSSPTLLKLSTSSNVGHSLNNHVRTMDIPPLSFAARNNGYQNYGNSSNYLREEVERTTVQRGSRSYLP